MPELLPTPWTRRLLSAAVGRMAPIVLALPGPARLWILNYHRINYRVPSFTLDPDVISATPEVFDAHVQFCRAHFDIISFRDLDAAVADERPLPRRPLIITFDDGYEDNYRYAYPVLKDYGVSATFFLVTSYVSSDRLFWWDQAAVTVNTYDGDAVDIDLDDDHLHLDLSTSDARRTSLRRLLRLLKRVPDQSRIETLERLDHATAHRCAPVPGRQTLTWDEAREMQRGGMEIGSHSLTHPVLSQVGPEELRQQVSGSKAALEARLGCEVGAFSYPVGGAAAVTHEVSEEVRAAGYRFGVSYVNGTNRLNASLDRYTMKRLHVDGLGEQEFRMRLAAPTL